MEKSCRKYAPNPNLRPLLNLVNSMQEILWKVRYFEIELSKSF